ncbi:YdcF family protein [Vibrio genomosp. F10]|uniref:YdcF family protein n=1 Tax=Vibrio genomosp. F10 TaxID=723171 RepID=UPI0002EEF688|nr:YdcF family protein [Vibrio genomosp. F10]OEF08527.1 hypothetical protein A1QK_06300 [Vibrio genomosp. F10 str. 9ZD137]
MSIDKIIILLGKRLQDSQLTLEGKSRVDGLIQYLAVEKPTQTALLFCGGVTKGQAISESQAMYDYFLLNGQELDFPAESILLEQDSTSTVENIQHGAQALLDSGLIHQGTTLKVVFASNDYHLHRIFEIQNLMDEQGLLGVLYKKCLAQGATLSISYQLNDHIVIPYPYTHLNADLFMQVDALTTYRVYLEGVVANAFDRELSKVRDQPYQIAQAALERIHNTLDSNASFLPLTLVLSALEHAVNDTVPSMPIRKVREYLAVLDTNLTLLNRYLDPESQLDTCWWR